MGPTVSKFGEFFLKSLLSLKPFRVLLSTAQLLNYTHDGGRVWCSLRLEENITLTVTIVI